MSCSSGWGAVAGPVEDQPALCIAHVRTAVNFNRRPWMNRSVVVRPSDTPSIAHTGPGEAFDGWDFTTTDLGLVERYPLRTLRVQ